MAYRHWCNKLWNAIKFAMRNLGDDFVPSPAVDAATLPLACRWLLSRLNAAAETVNTSLEAYEFGAATQAGIPSLKVHLHGPLYPIPLFNVTADFRLRAKDAEGAVSPWSPYKGC